MPSRLEGKLTFPIFCDYPLATVFGGPDSLKLRGSKSGHVDFNKGSSSQGQCRKKERKKLNCHSTQIYNDARCLSWRCRAARGAIQLSAIQSSLLSQFSRRSDCLLPQSKWEEDQAPAALLFVHCYWRRKGKSCCCECFLNHTCLEKAAKCTQRVECVCAVSIPETLVLLFL